MAILAKGLIKEERYNYKPGKEKNWNYMSTEARFRCVAGSTDRDLKENEVHLGHESGKGASQHWNGRISGEKHGHTQTKKQNQVWNKNSDNYRGPEESHYSSSSGRDAEEYVIPGPHLDPPSHPMWWDSDHPDYVEIT